MDEELAAANHAEMPNARHATATTPPLVDDAMMQKIADIAAEKVKSSFEDMLHSYHIKFVGDVVDGVVNCLLERAPEDTHLPTDTNNSPFEAHFIEGDKVTAVAQEQDAVAAATQGSDAAAVEEHATPTMEEDGAVAEDRYVVGSEVASPATTTRGIVLEETTTTVEGTTVAIGTSPESV